MPDDNNGQEKIRRIAKEEFDLLHVQGDYIRRSNYTDQRTAAEFPSSPRIRTFPRPGRRSTNNKGNWWDQM
jgi:hypothetical protein